METANTKKRRPYGAKKRRAEWKLKRHDYYSTAELRQRGWHLSQIERWLGESGSDEFYSGRRYWLKQRVEAIETEALAPVDYLTKQKLRERGFTPAAIHNFLGDPDETGRNPIQPHYHRLCLYRLDRVEAVETSPDYQAWRERITARRALAREISDPDRDTWAEAEAHYRRPE